MAGPGDEQENGWVAVQGGHMDSRDRVKLKPQDSQEFFALRSLDTISGGSGDRLVGILPLQC